MVTLIKVAVLAVVEFGGFHLFVTGVERAVKFWDTPLMKDAMLQSWLGALAMIGGVFFAGLFMQKTY